MSDVTLLTAQVNGEPSSELGEWSSIWLSPTTLRLVLLTAGPNASSTDIGELTVRRTDQPESRPALTLAGRVQVRCSAPNEITLAETPSKPCDPGAAPVPVGGDFGETPPALTRLLGSDPDDQVRPPFEA